MNTWMRARAAGSSAAGARAHVGLEAAGESGDHGAVDLLGDGLHRREVTRGAVREARFDDVDLEPRELMGDLQLVGRR